MTASQTGVEAALETLTEEVRAAERRMILVEVSDVSALLADHAALTARIDALEGEGEKDGELLQAMTAATGDYLKSGSELAMSCKEGTWGDLYRAARARLAARQSREETGDRK